MKVKITARKFKAREGLKEFIEAELESLERYNSDLIEGEVILSFQNQKDSVKTAEIIVRLPGQIITVTETTEEFEKSVHLAVDKIIRQLAKLKVKHHSRKP